jgi:hypothetical protein
LESALTKQNKKGCGHIKGPILWLKRAHHQRPYPPLLRERPRPWRPHETSLGEFKVARKPFVLRLIKVVRENAELKRTFKGLAEKWKRETRHISSITKTSMHPAYQQIIGMGESAVPLILQEMQENGGHWLWALHAITREDPAHEGDDFDAAVQAWLNWGRSRGHI